MNRIYRITAGLLCVAYALLACDEKKVIDEFLAITPLPAAIISGNYQRINIPEAQPDPIALGVVRMDIDRDHQQVIFKMEDGSEIPAVINDANSTWSQGCPTNSNTTRMEMLYLEEDLLVLDGVTFDSRFWWQPVPFLHQSLCCVRLILVLVTTCLQWLAIGGKGINVYILALTTSRCGVGLFILVV